MRKGTLWSVIFIFFYIFRCRQWIWALRKCPLISLSKAKDWAPDSDKDSDLFSTYDEWCKLGKFSRAHFSNIVSVVRNLGVALKEGFLTWGYSYNYLQDVGQCCGHLKARHELEDLLLEWPTHIASKLVLALGLSGLSQKVLVCIIDGRLQSACSTVFDQNSGSVI